MADNKSHFNRLKCKTYYIFRWMYRITRRWMIDVYQSEFDYKIYVGRKNKPEMKLNIYKNELRKHCVYSHSKPCQTDRTYIFLNFGNGYTWDKWLLCGSNHHGYSQFWYSKCRCTWCATSIWEHLNDKYLHLLSFLCTGTSEVAVMTNDDNNTVKPTIYGTSNPKT